MSPEQIKNAITQIRDDADRTPEERCRLLNEIFVIVDEALYHLEDVYGIDSDDFDEDEIDYDDFDDDGDLYDDDWW